MVKFLYFTLFRFKGFLKENKMNIETIILSGLNNNRSLRSLFIYIMICFTEGYSTYINTSSLIQF